jgi:signal transduction histidine kinase
LAFGLAEAAAQRIPALDDFPAYSQPAPTASKPVLNPTNGLGSWIWTTNTYPRQTCRLWKAFDVPGSAPVVRALLRITADNGYTLFVDGREVGRGINWRVVTEYDVVWLLDAGRHVLAVDAFNDADTGGANVAGVILGLRVTFANGHTMEVGTDRSWRVVPKTEQNWQTRTHASAHWIPARVIGPWGSQDAWRVPWKIASLPPEPPLPVRFWQKGWFQVMILSVCGIAVLVCLRLMAQMTLQSKAQQLLQLERARIARDIHDDLGAGLTKLVLLGEVVQSELRTDLQAREQIGQLCEKARDLSRVMDEVVWAINSRRDTLRDFATYVCKYAQAYLSATPIRCRLDVEPEMPTVVFDLPIRRNLFLAVKEALNNAAKHSGATELFLRIHRQGEGLSVVVEDNGQGFDLAHASPERNGLTNMTQRMKEVGGGCQVSGEPGTGCRVAFTLPRLQAQPRPRWLNWRLGQPAQRTKGVESAQQPAAEGAAGLRKPRNA